MSTNTWFFAVAIYLVGFFILTPDTLAETGENQSSLSPFLELGATIKVAENHSSPLNGGAFIGKIGLMRRNAVERSWGASLSWLWSDNAGVSGQSHPQNRLWLLLQHRRPLGDGFFRYWGLEGGTQVWSDFDDNQNFEITSIPVILEVELGVAGFLTVGMILEFFSFSYESTNSIYSGGNTTDTIVEIKEDSARRISLSIRLAFGRWGISPSASKGGTGI